MKKKLIPESQPVEGKAYWRSLDQLSETPEFNTWLEREFPDGAAEMSNGVTRRNFLSLMGASLALAGLTGCRRPLEKIIPYVNSPENITLGIPQHFATAIPFGLSAYGLLVESHESKPTKVEGNPAHSSSVGGAANHFVQASILNLYDPDRSMHVTQRGENKKWADFLTVWQKLYSEFKSSRGKGLAVLTESFASPSMMRVMNEFKAQFPEAVVVSYEPVSDENIYNGIKLATGDFYQPVYHFEAAKVILSLDSDFVQMESESITSSRGFADGRKVMSEKGEMNRLYVVETNYSLTGGMADHRLRLQSRLVPAFAAALATELKSLGADLDLTGLSVDAKGLNEKWIKAVAKDLLEHKGEALVVAGRRQPAEVHALVYAINRAIGGTVQYRPFSAAMLPNAKNFAQLVKAMESGAVNTLVMLGGNPVYSSAADLNFAGAMTKVAHSVHLASHQDETSRLSEWHLPASHYLEAWGDTISVDGTLAVIQPLIEPLFNKPEETVQHSALELLHLIAMNSDKRGYELVRETWKPILNGDNEKAWRKVLHDGIYAGEKISNSATEINGLSSAFASNVFKAVPATAQSMEVVFAASSATFDGRFANNGWLQELPDSVSKLAWDNTAVMSMRTASELGLKNEDVITVSYQGRKVDAPVWVQPGHADYSITLALGFGRTAAGRVGNNVGFNAYAIRTSVAPDFDSGVTVAKVPVRYQLANTQEHGSMEGRPLIREASLETYREEPNFAKEAVEVPPLTMLWDEHRYDTGNQWGMVIDLNSCTGCNACAVACQSENNIPIVGKEQVRRGREMHWIRLDRYYNVDTDVKAPELKGKKPEELKVEEMMRFEDLAEMVHQPVACQHCENAPCEQVCPVAATVHDHEGLNAMVYNRCIGTKYCANNCPYKVRRFNFFNYVTDNDVWGGDMPEIVKMAQNPDVTVRYRGVMEKCTYCVQRIREGEQASKIAGRELKDGDIKTACQQTCPTQAITFGNIIDKESKVSKMREVNRNYGLLEELNVRPRTTYLARLRNPNPELEPASAKHNDHHKDGKGGEHKEEPKKGEHSLEQQTLDRKDA